MKAATKTAKKKEFVIVSTYKDRTIKENKLVGEAFKLKFPVAKDAEVLTEVPKPEDVKGKIVIGSLIPTYIAEAAEEVIEANTQSYRKLSEKMRKLADAEDVAELMNFEHSYIIRPTEISRFLAEDGSSL